MAGNPLSGGFDVAGKLGPRKACAGTSFRPRVRVVGGEGEDLLWKKGSPSMCQHTRLSVHDSNLRHRYCNSGSWWDVAASWIFFRWFQGAVHSLTQKPPWEAGEELAFKGLSLQTGCLWARSHPLIAVRAIQPLSVCLGLEYTVNNYLNVEVIH